MAPGNRTLWITLLAGLLGVAAIWTVVAVRGGVDSEVGVRTVDDPLAGFDHPRTIHIAPDGRLVVTDVGTGNDDGRVVAIDLQAETREVLLRDLPSTEWDGSSITGISGASGAAMAPDGTICVAIGDGPDGEGFNELRCTDGLRVDLLAYERDNNPGGGAIESNPFDVVHGGRFGDWYVTDAGANVVLHVSSEGHITVLGIMNEYVGLGGREGEPMGLAITGEYLSIALFGGAVITAGEGFSVPVHTRDAQPIAVVPANQEPKPGVGKGALILSHATRGSPENTGTIQIGDSVMVDGLDRPTGFVRLDDGRFVVAEETRGRLRIVGEAR